MVYVPEFIHIGFSKAASSWIQSFFKEQKQIFLVEKTRFFSPLSDEFCKFRKGEKYYLQFFNEKRLNQIAVESDEHIILPDFNHVLSTRGTILKSLEVVFDRIKVTNPNFKIILVIRNQYDLIISRYSQYIVTGGCLKFKDFFNELLNCSLDNKNYYQNYYNKIILKLYEIFGSKNVHIILQEELKSNRNIVLNNLKDFIGMSTIDANTSTFKSQRKGLSKAGLSYLRYFNKIFVKEKEDINGNMKLWVPLFFYKDIVRIIRVLDFYFTVNILKANNLVLTNSMHKKLYNLYDKDNRKLAELLNKDLSKFGYIKN